MSLTFCNWTWYFPQKPRQHGLSTTFQKHLSEGAQTRWIRLIQLLLGYSKWTKIVKQQLAYGKCSTVRHLQLPFIHVEYNTNVSVNNRHPGLNSYVIILEKKSMKPLLFMLFLLLVSFFSHSLPGALRVTGHLALNKTSLLFLIFRHS